MRIASLSAFPIDVDRTRRGGAFGSTERDAASAILRAVRRGGDAAVLRTVRRFDNARARPDDLIVEGAALRRAARDCPRDVSRALDLAYGTRSLPRVDKIVGPGNAYTAGAKWLVSADVGIDALQGPSELVAVASSDADVDALALDLLAQAEHGAGAFAALISDDAAWVRAVAEAIGARTARVRGYRARDLGAAVSAANDAAPENVLLPGRRAIALADRVNRAGALFIGARSAVAFGDYVAGTNHALPTGGTARWSSALRVDDYVRWTSRVSLHGELRNLARAAAAIADHEGMRFHKASIEARV